MLTKRRWGYIVWIVAGAVIAIPEIWAAADKDDLPFTTISEMVGHLERHHTWVELIVVALIVLALYSALRVPPHGPPPAGAPPRTPGGRLTLRPGVPPPTAAQTFDDDDAPALFAASAVVVSLGIALATSLVAHWWNDAGHFRASYVLYGSLGFFWLLVPSVLALVKAADVPFPTLVHSIRDLEDWLRTTWPNGVGDALAFVVAYVVLAGLAILLIHLTLYPYPDITQILNPGG